MDVGVSGLCLKSAMQVMLLSTLSSALVLTSVPLRYSWKEVIAVSRIFLSDPLGVS